MKIFPREISEQEMGISSKEVVLIRTVLQQMCYVTSLGEYEALYKHLLDISSERVISYFNNNWKDIVEEWINIQTSKLIHYSTELKTALSRLMRN